MTNPGGSSDPLPDQGGEDSNRPPPILSGGGVGQEEKNQEGEDLGAGPSRTVIENPPSPLPPPPPPAAAEVEVEEHHPLFFCPECPKGFPSDRGLCGHMRTHKERPWRGAFPPPMFSRDEFYDAGVGHLLNPPFGGENEREEGEILADPVAGEVEEQGGEEILAAPRAEESAAGPSGEEKREVPDLNEPPPCDEHGNYL
ncbi:hypothetical protein Acr_00g0062690 [Actinidia rufa]|uniref:C2H2-type domain-containing protein n=1 Tax=Actinidia rufa TaxID=165716 RepID=A0A7J0DP17_9ERIC|nr:hypothetical protein Acr_00g0062690 [Actinidia rufa]